VPFEQVVEALQPVRSLSYSPVFQVMFVLQNTLYDELRLPGLTLAMQAESSNETAKFDLSLSLQEVEGDISGTVSYAADLFDRGTIERWLGYFRNVLSGMVQEAKHEGQ
jgi:non-ribosomal peptide synthetase component F